MPPLELKFLTEDPRLIELARLYWELDQDEKVFPHHLKGLAPKFAVPANKILKTVMQNCEASSPAIACETCGRARPYDSRNDYLEAQRYYRQYGSWQCPDCYWQEAQRRRDEERTRQEIAEQQARALRQRRQELIEKAYTRQEAWDYLLPTEVSFTSTIYLLSCIQAGGPVCTFGVPESGEDRCDETDILSPRITKNISPTKAFDEEILDRLKSRGLIAVCPASQTEAFEFYEEQIVGYDSRKVLWVILPDVPVNDRHSFIWQVEDRLNRREHKTWHQEWPQMWKRIAVEECIQFLVHSLERHNYSYTLDGQATELFSGLVGHYSLAQVFNLIAKAIKDFVSFAREQRWPMKASRVVEKVRDNEAFYRSQGWPIYSFNYRPAYPSRSVISRIFFNDVLGISDDYFFKAPKDVEMRKIDKEPAGHEQAE
jgi:hypothetical protein